MISTKYQLPAAAVSREPQGRSAIFRSSRAKTARLASISRSAIPAFGRKNHIGIDRRHCLIRSWTATDASRHDGALLPALIDKDNTASGVWAPYPSAEGRLFWIV